MKQLYTKFNLTLVVIVLFSFGTFAQQSNSIWTKTTQSKLSILEHVFRKSEPKASAFYQLDINVLKNILQNAPQRGDLNGPSNVLVDFPTVDGKLESFRVMEASVMHPSLQAQFPEIRSYVGQSIDNPSSIIRFSLTPQGLHSMLFSSENGTEFIDPYTKSGNNYIVYAKSSLPALEEPFICEFIDGHETAGRSIDFDVNAAINANDGQLRTYDLALACTIEYSAFHVTQAGLESGTLAQKKAAVLTAMGVTMTRVNGVYEKELSLTMVLVPNNLDIIFVDSDTFDNNNASALINQSQSVIDATIGSANYDIGHTFSTGGGGLAQLNSPCVNGSKARGITGLPAPVGDGFDIDFVAHEMGHQFGSNHTFNGSTSNCAGGNRSPANAYEPGSGSTIMAYAGICAPQNVQSNSDDYFHQRSLATIWANISSGASSTCSTNTPSGNSAPTAQAGADYIIPNLTPHKLTAISTDTDGVGTHTFTWEQYDLGPAGVPTETTASGPLVRSFEGTADPVRYIPRLPDLLSNYGSSTWEKLVSIARPINYRVTVRDNDTRGGQTATDGMIATVSANAGPFIVTSQSEDQLVWTPATSETITWNVAGTTGNGINTSNVNILLSTDGGLTYDTVLASNTPNDGSEVITVPAISEPYCRVMVEPVGNIYFSINTKDFAVGDYTYVLSDVCEDYEFTTNIAVPVNSQSYQGYGLTVPDSFTISDFNISVDFTHANIGDLFYGFRAPFETAGVNRLASGSCPGASNAIFTFDDDGTAVNCASTASGDVITPLDPLDVVNGENSAGQWIFFMTDVVDNGVNGVWNSATLTLCRSGLVPTLNVDELNVEDSFTIYPNPNNGNFNIKLKSYSGRDIQVNVYDVRGRSIFNNSYNNASDFEQEINLNNVQSGLYLVSVSDGDKQATKKIIIE